MNEMQYTLPLCYEVDTHIFTPPPPSYPPFSFIYFNHVKWHWLIDVSKRKPPPHYSYVLVVKQCLVQCKISVILYDTKQSLS